MKKILSFLLLGVALCCTAVSAQKIKASFSQAIFDQPFTGNVIVYLSKENKEPKEGAVGFDYFPCFRLFVRKVKPGEMVTFDDDAISYPAALSDIERGDYYAQVVWDRNLGGRSIANSAGNLYSTSQRIHIDKDRKAVIQIAATKAIPGSSFNETQFVKELKAPSALLSKFHNKAVTVDVTVQLPKEYYQEPERKFPVLFTVFGYGGDHHRFSASVKPSQPLDSVPVIIVYLDGNCPLGHSVYANSDNNGPWGDALTKELIPLLETTYRCNGAKLLTGHSSGGWTVLWLQTQYPDIFDGCWSSSPDPVDFRSFQKINLYEDKNMFYAPDSSQHWVGTVAGMIPWASQKAVYQAEHVIYRGEQMHSFDAVFSAKGTDGLPLSICNSKTGEIDHAVFEHWKRYDISLYLRNNWEKIKPVLDGKVRISVGTGDNFLLNHAVVLLENEMKKIHAGFTFAYYPGDHFTVSSPEYRKDGNHFLLQKYTEWLHKK